MENISIEKERQPRFLEEMMEVLKNPAIIQKIGPKKIIYDVYREVETVDELRYDLTYLYGILLGDEFSKTYGHVHEHLEIMEVVSNEVMWLLQKHDENNPKIIKEAYLVHAKQGEKAIFPSWFGTISINPTQKKTVLSNWMSKKTSSNYDFNKQMHGGCYYVIKNKNGEIAYDQNPNYEKVPELIKLKPKELPNFGIIFDKPLISLKETPEKLEFISNPRKYKNILTIENCYEKI